MEKQVVEQYLKTVLSLSEGDKAVKTNEIARAMKLAPASVTESLQKLSGKGYVKYEAYRGARLTRKGRRIASEVSRKHRLLERFLADVLGIEKSKVHKQACAMEHDLDGEAEIALCRMLNHPDTCPDDGKEIPPCNLNVESCAECARMAPSKLADLTFKGDLSQLTELSKGEKGKIQFIRGGETEVKKLHNMGLTRGADIQLMNIAPFSGPIEVTVRGCKIALGRGIASKIFVQKAG